MKQSNISPSPKYSELIHSRLSFRGISHIKFIPAFYFSLLAYIPMTILFFFPFLSLSLLETKVTVVLNHALNLTKSGEIMKQYARVL